MYATAQNHVEERKSLGVLNISRHDGLDTLTVFTHGKTKRQIAEELVKKFGRHGGLKPEAYNLKGLDLSGADLRGLDLRVFGEAALRQMNFKGANLSGQNFANMNLRGATFESAILTSADFSYATLDNANLNGALLGSASFFNVSAGGTYMNDVKAPMANLNGGFRGASISGDLSYGYLGDGTTFEGAKMRGAHLANLRTVGGDVIFRNADLTDATVSGDLAAADFEGATFTRTRFEAGNFENIKMKGAETAGMQAPSMNMQRTRGHGMYESLKEAFPEKPETEVAKLALEQPRPNFHRAPRFEALMM